MHSRNIRISGFEIRTFCFSLFVCVLSATVSVAQPENTTAGLAGQPALGEESLKQPRRTPPKVAVDACIGKKEGDLCAFNAPEGVRDGECLSGGENVFACRPFRGAESREPVEVNAREQKAMQRNASPQVVRARATNSEEAMNPLSTSPDIKPVTPVTSAERVPPDATSQSPPLVGKTTPSTPTPVKLVTISDMIVGNPWSYLVVSFLSILMTWYAFYRFNTLPLRRLRKVTQQLAGGDLSARVGEGLVHRKDEVADLARDVDRMAERIESLVGAHQRLIRDVSHELRSPLARLNVALELARQSAGVDHSAPFDRIERESERLNELIGQLLMLTRLESDSNMNQREDVDIAALISDVAHDVDFEAQSNNRRVLAKAVESTILSGNRELLRQALENLVRNAARYTEAGTEVEILLKRKESGGRSWAHIEVRDHGPGVPESVLYDIFRPFYRVSDSRERQSGGTGVGLAISDRAVRLHGGSLRAFNAPGGGLIMEMELPLA